VVLCRTPHGNLHAGLLFKINGITKVLHLGWEDVLLDELDLAGLWIAPKVQPELLFAAARMCRSVWRRYLSDRKLPYALKYEGTTFDADGRLLLAPGARGLTCASFILAVLASVGIILIDEQTWPIRRDDDREFLMSVRRFASPDQVAVLKEEVERGVRRIRPDEVTAACLWNPPACFGEVQSKAEGIVALLDEQARRA